MLLEYVIEQISSRNIMHGKKLKNNLKKFDEDYFNRADTFLKKYETVLHKSNKTLDYAIDCYLQMLADVNYESVQFIQTGEYSSKSFDEVNRRVYNNPAVMEYYMHGLLLRQFLLPQNYKILLFFNKKIKEYKNVINHYLEVGGGHGLYVSEAIESAGNITTYDLVDISQSSIDIAEMMIDKKQVSYVLSDVFEYHPLSKYDFISMGEVLEHVEEPVSLLRKLHEMLNDSGKVFITTVTNAPAIDHIYLFKNADEIRKVIAEAGFEIEAELCIWSEDLLPELCEKYKVSMMYAGVLAKKII